MKNEEKYALILNQIEYTKNRIKLIEKECAENKKPILSDIIKTEKSMCYEKIIEIIEDKANE